MNRAYLETIEFIRQRPAMFVRSTNFDGICYMICGLMENCASVSSGGSIFTTISVDKESISLEIVATHNIASFINCFFIDGEPETISEGVISYPINSSMYFPLSLVALTKKLTIQNKAGTFKYNREQLVAGEKQLTENGCLDITMRFVLDNSIFQNVEMDFEQLGEKLFRHAILHRQTEILVKDHRLKYLLQNYYHYPEGIFYLHKRYMAEVLRTSEFNILIDEQIGGNKYQIAISYRADWCPGSTIVDFCNDRQVGGWWPLTKGTETGIATACRKYTKQNGLVKHKITKSSINRQLILVCAIRSSTYNFRGCDDDIVDDTCITKEVIRLVSDKVTQFFNTHPQFTKEWFDRFNEPQSIVDRLNAYHQQLKTSEPNA